MLFLVNMMVIVLLFYNHNHHDNKGRKDLTTNDFGPSISNIWFTLI